SALDAGPDARRDRTTRCPAHPRNAQARRLQPGRADAEEQRLDNQRSRLRGISSASIDVAMRQRGIAFRLSALMLAGSGFVLSLVVGYNYWSERRTFVKAADESARNLALATVNRVEAVLHATEKLPATRARTLEHGTYSEEDLRTLLRYMVEDNPEVYG